MKQKLLKTWLMLVLLLVGVGTTWGAEGDTHDFTQTLSQLLNNSASISSIEIPAQSYPVKEVKVTWNYNKSTSEVVTIAVTVGTTDFGSAKVGTSTTSTNSFTGTSTTGAVTISFTNHAGSGTGKGTFKVTNVQLVEGASGGSTPTKYGITIDVSNLGNTGNGFSVNGTYYSSYQYLANAAASGETVTLSASPKSGYKATADCWNVYDGNMNAIAVTGSGNNYSFTMPAGKVSISPVYVADSNEPTKLSKPTNLSTANITATSADLSWDAVANASSYKLTVYDDEFNTLVDNQPVNATTYSVSGLTAETHYNWYVTAVGDGVNYSNSDASVDDEFTTIAQGGGDEPSGNSETATFVFNTDDGLSALGITKPEDSKGTNLGVSNYTSGDITMTATTASGKTATRIYNSQGTTDLRIYEGGTLTFSGATITKIELAGNAVGGFSANGGEYSSNTWTGSSTSVTLTATATERINTIRVTYASDGKTTPTLSFENPTYNATLGEDFTAPTLTNSEGVTVTYSSSETGVATVNSSTGAIELVGAGTTTITASFAGNETYNEASASYTLNVAAAPVPITDKTIAEFIAAEGGKCYLTGIVSNIKNTTYGNFTLTDESGSIYIYGCLTTDEQKGKFSTLDVVAGDKIKVLADAYEYYNSTTHEAKDVIFIEEIAIEKTKYTVTIETPENGTLVVKEGENVLESGAQVEEGKTLTIECTPTDAENYRYKNWQYKEDGDWVTMKTTMTRMVTKDISIRANFEEIPVHTIAWSVNGTIEKSEDLKEGADVTAPADPEPINGKVFTGWIETATVVGETPAYVTPSATATKTVTYYAVFATQTGSAGGTGTIELTNDDIKNIYDSKSTSYKEGTIGDWSFKGAINKTSDTYYVQMNRETNNTKNAYNSHLSTPVCPAPIKSVAITTTNATANGRTFILTNSAEVGAATTDGEGVYGYGSLTEAAGSVTIDVTGNPTSLHIYPHGGAVYVSSVVITYGEDPTYTDYCTIAEKKNPPLSFENVTYYATMDEDFTAPELNNPENLTVSYSSSDTDVATVDAKTGEITLVADGTTTITACFDGTESDIYNPFEVGYVLQVNPSNKFTIYINNEYKYGTLVVKNGETIIDSGDKVAQGTELTIECIPNVDYRFENWQYMEGESGWETCYDNPQSFIMPSADVMFKANFERIPTYSVSWKVNGRTAQWDKNVKEGDDLLPPSVDDICGKKFMGWVKTTAVDPLSTPIYETIGNFTEDSDVTYYAVFATVSTGSEETYSNFTTEIYSRTVTNGNYGTICLLEDVCSIEGAIIYNIAGTTKKNGEITGIVLTENEGVMEAGKPYIFKATANLLVACCSSSSFDYDFDILNESYGLVGNPYSADMEVPKNCYVLSDNKIRMVNTGTAYVRQNRAYIDLHDVEEYTSAGVKALYFGFDGSISEETAIKMIEQNVENTTIYNLNGQRVSKAQKGIYIVNGKKVMFK